jgi:Holliday junction resolvasome RuvABC endonuclease subunit
MIAKIGIDLSMNSSGITIIVEEKSIIKHFIISNVAVKSSANVQLLTYKRDHRNVNYSYSDLATVNSANSLAKRIYGLLIELSNIYGFQEVDARIEGSIMSQGFKKHQAKVNDLTVFNSSIKRMLISCELVKSITVVAPTTLKKWATGKGNAKKEQILEEFLKEFPKFDMTGKIDDIADSYYLAKGNVDDSQKYIK